MLAIRKLDEGPGHISVETVDVPQPGPEEVLLRIQAAGICGFDRQLYHWSDSLSGRMTKPVTLGHEATGMVVGSGSAVTHLKQGDLVALESHLPCGWCNVCRLGQPHVCPNTTYPGLTFDGGFADFAVVPERLCFPVSADTPSAVAAMYEPFGLGVHACTLGTGVQGQSVVVSGCGPIGLMTILIAQKLGAREVIALEVNEKRFKLAEDFGATRVFNPSVDSDAKIARQINGGNGADVFLEFSGAEASLLSVASHARNGAALRIVGVPHDPVRLDISTWVLKGLNVECIHGRELHRTWSFSQHLLPELSNELSRLVTHELPLEEAQQGFDILDRGEGIKVIFRPELN